MMKTVGVAMWGLLSGAALRYLGITRAIGAGFAFNSLGSLINSLGRVVIPASGLTNIPSFLRGFVTMFGNLAPSVARLVNSIWPLIRGFGIFGGIMLALNSVGIGLRDILRGIVLGFQSLWNGLLDIIGFTDHRGGYLLRDLKADTSWYDRTKYDNANVTGTQNPYEDKSFENMKGLFPKQRNAPVGGKPVSQTVVNIIMDGKVALTKMINNEQEQDLYASYGLT